MVRRIAFAYPGQGSHRQGMVRAWAGTPSSDVVASVGACAGLDLLTLGDDATACGASTALGQPAILAASLAADRALREAGVEPDVVAGHSLGELTAATAAGVLSLADGATVAAARGRAMGAACRATPGAMAAVVRLDPAAVEEHLTAFDQVVVANNNAPGQVVVSGALPQFDEAIASLRAAGGRVIPLDVEGAFHSPAMAPAIVALGRALHRVDLHDPVVPLVTGVDGSVLHHAADVRRHLVDGVLASVRWVDVQDRLLALGVDLLVEVGPGGVLAAIARRAHPGLEVRQVACPEDVADVAALVHARHASVA